MGHRCRVTTTPATTSGCSIASSPETRQPSASVYDRHSRLLFGLILRILGDRGEAEEVLQDVFLQVWTRAQTFNVELGTPIAWIVRIARNRAIDRLRARAARTPPPAAPLLPASTDNPEAHAALTEQQRAVSRALDTLPADARQLLEHAYFSG